eukprot:CAMPEP_0198146498 /NCGR_PEP_ID=MMETSP1443-20131203/29616_1 /TAXON_ID=186043 /ORGANISM="Entomoneis sp., Strain CCMP2396" /LENGTH=77 /DNA_ID=CAMNT_0043810485 /DNA_START=160 /DNA_END=393 /DNA_ORIENTATION=-
MIMAVHMATGAAARLVNKKTNNVKEDAWTGAYREHQQCQGEQRNVQDDLEQQTKKKNDDENGIRNKLRQHTNRHRGS